MYRTVPYLERAYPQVWQECAVRATIKHQATQGMECALAHTQKEGGQAVQRGGTRRGYAVARGGGGGKQCPGPYFACDLLFLFDIVCVYWEWERQRAVLVSKWNGSPTAPHCSTLAPWRPIPCSLRAAGFTMQSFPGPLPSQVVCKVIERCTLVRLKVKHSVCLSRGRDGIH